MVLQKLIITQPGQDLTISAWSASTHKDSTTPIRNSHG